MNGQTEGLLQRLRNADYFGPAGLVKFRLPPDGRQLCRLSLTDHSAVTDFASEPVRRTWPLLLTAAEWADAEAMLAEADQWGLVSDAKIVPVKRMNRERYGAPKLITHLAGFVIGMLECGQLHWCERIGGPDDFRRSTLAKHVHVESFIAAEFGG